MAVITCRPSILLGLPQMAESEGSTYILMLGCWHKEHACGGNLCMVEADWTRPLLVWHRRVGSPVHSLPSWLKVSWYVLSFLISSRASNFPRPVRAHTVSQPMKTCNPIRASQMLSPNELAIFPNTMNRVLFIHTSDRWSRGCLC